MLSNSIYTSWCESVIYVEMMASMAMMIVMTPPSQTLTPIFDLDPTIS